ncbi:hypothetical protein BB558_005742 [Smittium angustum]|uniref:Kinetochore protein NDC80 n=1 Tax=Smittium angustum TaxID=133377 RepID=A0A2U1IZN6_SMIAN|nr:hypothetical protein BB558_005742 [Smittium angustum]
MNPRRKTVSNNNPGNSRISFAGNRFQAEASGSNRNSIAPYNRMSIAPQQYNPPVGSNLNILRKTDSGRMTPMLSRTQNTSAFVPDSRNHPGNTLIKKVGIRMLTQTPAGKNTRIGNLDTISSKPPGTINTTIKSRGNLINIDPRPIRDAQFQADARRKITNYLISRRYEKEINARALENPTIKNIEDIFKFIYGRLDPLFRYSRKFEDDIFAILKVIEYPYIDTITKTMLRVPSSVNNWPTVLAFILWMTELNLIVENMESPNTYVDEFSGQNSSVRFEDKVFYQYLITTYPIWLNGNDEPPEVELDLAEQFELKSQHTSDENTHLENQLSSLKAELKQYQDSKSSLETQEELKSRLSTDITSLDGYLNKVEYKNSKTHQKIEALESELINMDTEYNSLCQNISNVNSILGKQSISIDEVDQMNMKRVHLCQVLGDAQTNLNTKKDELNAKETEIQRILDKIDQLEQTYNTGAKQIESHQAIHTNNNEKQPVQFPLSVIINTNSEDQHNLCKPNLKVEIQKNLYKVSELLLSQAFNLETTVFKTEEQINQLLDLRVELGESIDELEKQFRRAQETCAEIRSSIIDESVAPSMEINNLEKEIALIEKTITKMEQQAKHEYLTSKADSGLVTRKCGELNSNLNKEIVQSIDAILKMQTFIRTRLEETVMRLN